MIITRDKLDELIPRSKWGERRKSISILFSDSEVKALDLYVAQLALQYSLPKMTRTAVFNLWAQSDPRFKKLVKLVEREEKKAQRAAEKQGAAQQEEEIQADIAKLK